MKRALSYEEKRKEVLKKGLLLSEDKTKNAESILVYGSTGTGKTYFWTTLFEWFDKKGIKPENLLVWAIFPDRPGGFKKLEADFIPKKYSNSCRIFYTNDFQDVIDISEVAAVDLKKFAEEDPNHVVWFVVELLNEMWEAAQHLYVERAYDKTFADYFAAQRAELKDRAQKAREGKEPSAYAAFSGAFGGDWPIIKDYHNAQWIERVKMFPGFGVNVLFTAEEREEEDKGTLFTDIGTKPAGEKRNQHRVDTILHLTAQSNGFKMDAAKITGLSLRYSNADITTKIPYEVHLEKVARLKALQEKMKKKTDTKERTEEDIEVEEQPSESDDEKIEVKEEGKPPEVKGETTNEFDF